MFAESTYAMPSLCTESEGTSLNAYAAAGATTTAVMSMGRARRSQRRAMVFAFRPAQRRPPRWTESYLYGSSREGSAHHSSDAGVQSGSGTMQSTGHTGGRHFSQPEHSSGMMITSIPWLKMAPNCGGQWRVQVSRVMQVDMWI